MTNLPPPLNEDYLAKLAETEEAGNDIRAEMPYLRQAAGGYRFCRVLELGVRTGRSTSAFLAGCAQSGGHVWSVDINPPDVPARWYECRYWTFKQASDMDVDPELEGWPTSFHVLFIDTSHEMLHTLGELRRFVPYVAAGGMVLCHDTKLPGLQVAQALDLFTAEYHQAARVLPWQPGQTVVPAKVRWREVGQGRYGLGLIESPNGPSHEGQPRIVAAPGG